MPLFSRKTENENEVAHATTQSVARPTQEPVNEYTTLPPAYAEKATSYLRSLHEGDPNDKIAVPMIHSTHKLSFGDYLPWGSAMKTGKRTVISRSMTRDCYVKHYAKDEEGRYIGTERPYPDHQLVFVPTKSTPDEILQQLNEFVDVRHDIRRLHERKEMKHLPNGAA